MLKQTGILMNKMSLYIQFCCPHVAALCVQFQQELQVQQNEIFREMRLKEKLVKEVEQLHTDMEAKMGDIKALNLQGQRAKEEQQRLEQQLKELKVT